MPQTQAAPLHLSNISEARPLPMAGTCALSGARYPAGVALRAVTATMDGVTYEGLVPLGLVSLLSLRAVREGEGYTSPYRRVEHAAWAATIDDIENEVPPGSTLRVIYEGWHRPEVAVYRRLPSGEWAPKQGKDQTTQGIQAHLSRTRSGARMWAVLPSK